MRKAPKKPSSRLPLATTDSKATLYGNLIFANSWEDYSQMGIYSLNPNTAAISAVGLSDMLNGGGTYVDGKVYISYVETFWGFIFGLYTVEFDVESATVTNVMEHNTDEMGNYAINMAYDSKEGVIYSLNYNDEMTSINLCKFDRETFTYTVVAEADSYVAMAFDALGNLYVINDNGEVYTMDKTTAALTQKVAVVDYQPAYLQSACWSPRDNKIIWAASNDSDSRLIAVDPATGTSEVLCVYEDAEEFTCLYSTDPFAADGAPAEPSLDVSYEERGGLEADIEVYAPTTNVAGEQLDSSESMTLKVFIDDEEVKSVEKKPGFGISFTADLTEGSHVVTAYCTNSAGQGLSNSVRTYAGEDAPTAVKNLAASISDDGKVTLTWTAPTTGVNGGYVNSSTLHYTILRNDVEIASNVKATTYEDQLPGELSTYVYTVTAFSNEKEGQSANTEKLMFGNAIDLPYTQVFDNEACLDLYTIVDNNKDKNTWYYDSSSKALKYKYDSSNTADEYAFTPILKLPADRMVNVEITVYAQSSYYPEKIELTVGSDTVPANQTVVIPETEVDWISPKTLQAYFQVETEGEYHLGIHAVSDPDQYYLLVSDIRVSEGPSFNAPQAVSEATATPGSQGALQASISFKAPTLTFNEQTLTENVTVQVLRGDTALIGTKELAPGATAEVVDNAAANGFNSYTIRTFNNYGEGDYATVSCFCGLDTPEGVSDFKIKANSDNMSAVISWTAPTTGVNGGYVNPDNLTYTIYVPDASGWSVEYVDETNELSYTVMVDEEKLTGYNFYVSAKNTTGESDLVGGAVILGKPYELPFEEKISGSFTTSPWYLVSGNGDATWASASSVEVDDDLSIDAPDAGMIVCYNRYGLGEGSCMVKVPKMTLAGANAPTLYFSMYHYNLSDENKLSVKVTTDDELYSEIFSKKVNEGEGWTEYEVSLADYKTASWICIAFDGNVTADGYICIDYVIVENASNNDVKMDSLTGPTSLVAGEEGTFTATVLNKGYNDAAYTVNLLVNDAVVATQTQSEAIAKGESQTHTFSLTPSVEMIGNITVKAQAVLAGASDEMPGNDVASMDVTVKQPKLRVITDLTGTADSDLKNVELKWSEPVLTPESTVDDFESYESFALEGYGEYTLVDGDGAKTYGIQGVSFPNSESEMSFMVWSPAEGGVTSDIWMPHSGNKCLVSFATITGANDDYLISPEITGGSEVSFYATIPTTQYGPELFEVLYSTTTKDVDAFTLLKSESIEETGWTLYTYEMPANAKYFAIHYISQDVFALLIDDLSYVEANSNVDLVIMGYNVYCDGNLVTESPVTGTSYNYQSDAAASSLSFNVTVVYDEGESLKSNTVSFTSGLQDVKSLDAKVYGQTQSIKAENVAGRTVSIFATDGKLVNSVKATDNDVVIPASRGIYVVKVDNTAVSKVQVK